MPEQSSTVCDGAVRTRDCLSQRAGPSVEEYPAFEGKVIGGTLTLYMEVSGVEQIYNSLKERVKITMPLEKKFYGVTEFAFEDPDGYVITFAERTE